MSKTSNALEIIRRRYKHDDETMEILAEERIKSLAAMAIYDARTAAGLTQQQLADLVGTKQPVIARLEDADYEGHTTAMLQRIAAALNQRMEVRFVPLEAESTPESQREYTNALLLSLLSDMRDLRTEVSALKQEILAQRKQRISRKPRETALTS